MPRSTYTIDVSKKWISEIPDLPRRLVKGRRDKFCSPIVWLRKIKSNNNEEVIDPWPNHSSDKAKALKVVVLQDRNKLNTKNCGQTQVMYKPPLLERIEQDMMMRKLKLRTSNNGICKDRLMIYKEAFSKFIDSCSFYKPLLTNIKKEYDQYIEELEDQVRAIEPLKEFNYYITLNSDKRFATMGQQEELAKAKNQDLVNKIVSNVGRLENELLEREEVVQKVTNELTLLHSELRRNKEANIELSKHLAELQMSYREIGAMDNVGGTSKGIAMKTGKEIDQVIQMISLEQSQKQVQMLQSQLEALKSIDSNYVSVETVAKLEAKHQTEMANYKELEVLFQDTKDRNDKLYEKIERIEVFKDLYEYFFVTTSKTMSAKIEDGEKRELIDYFIKDIVKGAIEPYPLQVREFLEKMRDGWDSIIMKKAMAKSQKV